MEEFIKLDESYLKEISVLYRSAFMGEPWNDDWSDNTQLEEYIKDVSSYFNGLNYGLVKDGKLVAVSLGSIRHWCEDFLRIIDRMPYIIELDFDGNDLVGKHDFEFLRLYGRDCILIADDRKRRSRLRLFLKK